jgi:predicted amidohydrolase
MKIGYVQFNVEFGNVVKNIAKISELTYGKEFDLIVLPELANSGYKFSYMRELEELSEEAGKGEFSLFLKKLAKEKSAAIVSGFCEREIKDGISKFFNSSMLVTKEGEVSVYRKIHLYYDEKIWFTPGDLGLNVYEIETAQKEKVKLGMMICFDWIFPETARTLALKGAQIICHPSNLVMPYCQRAMFTRSLENCVYTITANRTGKDMKADGEIEFTGGSVMYDIRGNVIASSNETNEECILTQIDTKKAENKNLNKKNNLFKDRKVENYKI